MPAKRVLISSFFLLLLTSSSDSAQQCWECVSDGSACHTPARINCTRHNAGALVLTMAASMYPNAHLHALPSDKFSCISASFSRPSTAGAKDGYDVVTELKGCIFETDGKLCGDNAKIDGRFECQDCTKDFCNGALAKRAASWLVLVVSCLAAVFHR